MLLLLILLLLLVMHKTTAWIIGESLLRMKETGILRCRKKRRMRHCWQRRRRRWRRMPTRFARGLVEIVRPARAGIHGGRPSGRKLLCKLCRLRFVAVVIEAVVVLHFVCVVLCIVLLGVFVKVVCPVTDRNIRIFAADHVRFELHSEC